MVVEVLWLPKQHVNYHDALIGQVLIGDVKFPFKVDIDVLKV